MRLPYPKQLDNTPIIINLSNGIDENGVPILLKSITGKKCFFAEKSKTIYDTDGAKLQLLAKINICGDIASDVVKLEGRAIARGKEYIIFTATRCLNPDTTVHHTELELI